MMILVRVYAVVLAIWLCACVEDHLVHCANDLVCPQGSRCDDVHGSCATPDQVTACIGLADGDTCTANQLSGFCDHGVCIKPGCGNHVTEDNEVCDDGNTTSGDGCSADCTSLEACGNGVIDVVHGETCDDGNLLSRDGCDSQCAIEPLAFDVFGIAPSLGMPGWGAYDAGHHEVVHFADGILWAFAGDHWEIRSAAGPTNFVWHQVVYDPVRARVVVVGPIASVVIGQVVSPLVIWEWDGATWSLRATGVKALVSSQVAGTAVYEAKAKALLVVASSSTAPIAWELTDEWSDVSPMQLLAAGDGYSAAYDPATDDVIVVISHATNTPITAVWNGDVWTVRSTTLPNGTAGFALGWNLKLASVVAIGGSPATQLISAWEPVLGNWNTTTAVLPDARTLPEVVSGTTPVAALVFGGDNVGPHDDVYTNNNSGLYARVQLDVPPAELAYHYAYDDVHGRLVAVGQRNGQLPVTWQWDGTAWSERSTTSELTGVVSAIAFDPARGGIVALSSAGTFLLGDAGWTVIATGIGNVAVTYDPDGRLFAISNVVHTLGPSGSTWDAVASNTPATDEPSAAYDARDHELVLIGAAGGATYVLDTTAADATWMPTVSPGPAGYHVVEDRRRGTVWFVGAGAASWERIGGNWVMQPSLQLPIDGVSIYAASGDLFTIGTVGSSRVFVRRQFANASPIESCVAGEDTDGDGLAGCDDPDCYASCAACPPFATCP
jgi:cysteine-rich repeat protein